MRLTLYLPDALGRAAKDAGLNLSGLLRSAVERALRGELDEPQALPGAVVHSRPVPGGTEFVLFIPSDARGKPKA